MDLTALWYFISSLCGIVVGAISTAWTWGRKYQAIIQTQKTQDESLRKLWQAHEAHKTEVDQRLVSIGGQMIKALSEIKQGMAVLSTQTTNHIQNCVTQKQLGESTAQIMERLGQLEGIWTALKE